MTGKLDRVRVLDVTRVLAGPFVTMVLGDLGADVIKVEPPGGDETRTWPPFYDNGESGYYMSLNRNKRGIVLNLKNPKGKEVLFDLARKADVFVENFTPGVVNKLGIDYETLKSINQKIIYCSISGFGQTGPYRSKRAYDPVIQAMAGVMSITGVKDGEPVKVGIPIGDLGGSLMAVSSILAALFFREREGTGDYIDISMLDSLVALLSPMAAQYFADGTIPERLGLEHPWRVPSKTFKTKEGYISSSATSGIMYPKLCKALGLEGLIDDPRFKTNALRVKNRKALYPMLEKVMMTKTANEWSEIFEEAGLPNGVMKDLDQVFNDPHILERKMLQLLDYPVLGNLKMIGIPFKFLNSENARIKLPPLLGEDTDEVLREMLGYDHVKISDMRRKKVIS